MRRREIGVLASMWVATPWVVHAQGDAARVSAPNAVVISPKLVTSGQPSAAMLAQLGAQGFGAVVYLAPLTVYDAVREEPAILEKQGITFTHIPINFNRPSDADFEAFVAALQGFGDRKVLVHCQVNMRASSMVFLYRTIALKEAPEVAYEAVSRVWSPDGVWKQFIVTQLRKNGVAFDPY